MSKNANKERGNRVERPKPVKAVIRSLGVLRSVAKGNNRLREITANTKLGKSTIHRLLATFLDIGFVVQDPISRKYYLGPGILELLADATITHEGLMISAFEEMQYLRDLTRETALLHIRIGLQRVCIEEVESPESIKYTNGRGFVAPLYTGAAGKVLLSELSDDQVSVLLNKMNFVPITQNTIVDKRELLAEILKVREVGYATSFGERAVGSSCVSVPVRNYHVPVALSILGPDNRFSANKIEEYLSEIKEASRRISEKLESLSDLKRRQGY